MTPNKPIFLSQKDLEKHPILRERVQAADQLVREINGEKKVTTWGPGLIDRACSRHLPDPTKLEHFTLGFMISVIFFGLLRVVISKCT